MPVPCDRVEPSELHDHVIRCNPAAFEYVTTGHIQQQISVSTIHESRNLEPTIPATNQVEKDYSGSHNFPVHHDLRIDITSSSRKPKVKRKVREDISATVQQDAVELQDAVTMVICALESIHAALAIMAHNHMPKQLYKEEAFSANEPPTSGEVLTRQNIPFDISATRTSLPSTHPDLIERYQEFKSALKVDTIDYTTYTANIKRKRPAPRKGGRRTAGGYFEEEDDEDDADWMVGARRLNGSGRKGNGNRASRQRL